MLAAIATPWIAAMMAATVASGWSIMLGCEPFTCVIWALARSAIMSWTGGGITRSASPMTYQDGIVFQPSAAGALSFSAVLVSGRCVVAMIDAVAAGTSEAKTAP